MLRRLVPALVAVALIASAPPAGASAQVVFSGPAAHLTGFGTPVVVVSRSAPLTYVNGDVLFGHNVEASSTYGPGTNYWCPIYPVGECPLFWSPIIGTGQTIVDGISGTEVGKSYAFRCAPHPWMTGLIVVGP